MIQIKRVYEPRQATDGKRFLVERLWPRGIKKADLEVDAWVKEAGPTTGLRKWFSHDATKWKEFKRRYAHELAGASAVLKPILMAARRGRVTLVYSSHDEQHNNAVALKEYLEARLRRRRVSSSKPPAGDRSE